MLDANSPLTLQYQLRSALYEKINSGEWGDGYRIPSEYELCKIYGISRMTVREVLKEMVQSHYLVRKQGKGTFVSLPSVEATLTGSYSLTEEMNLRGKELTFSFISLKLIDATASAKQIFELKDGEKVYELTRLRRVEGEVFAWEQSTVPEKFLEGVTQEEIEENGLLNSIRKRTGLHSKETLDEIEPVICPGYVAADMGIPENTAVFKINRKTLSQSGYIEKCESYAFGQRLKVKRAVTEK